MIAVIADDFTGAAELGGIGLRYGLSVEISTAVPAATGADLLVIAADTRSTDEMSAVIEMEAVTKALLPLQPALVFKKTDSVLRGHIVAETIAQLKILQLPRALLVADSGNGVAAALSVTEYIFINVDDKHIPLYRIMWVAATPHFCGNEDCQREGQYEIRLEQGDSVWANLRERDDLLQAIETWQGGVMEEDDDEEDTLE